MRHFPQEPRQFIHLLSMGILIYCLFPTNMTSPGLMLFVDFDLGFDHKEAIESHSNLRISYQQ